MRYFLIFLILLFSQVSHANKAQKFDDFIYSFYSDFSQRHLKKVSTDYFHPDAQFIFGEHIMVPGSAQEIESVFQSIIKSLESDNYQKSIIKSIDKKFTGNKYIVATVYFDRLKRNNKKLDSMCSTYSAVMLSGKWKILSWLPSKPQKNNSCF